MKLAEGVPTAAAMKNLGEKVGIELPLTDAVYELCQGDCDKEKCNAVLDKLFSRETKYEF